MNERTLDALRRSIAHWRTVVANPFRANIGPSACPLCQVFWKPSAKPLGGLQEDSCHGCPVFERTGQQACAGSPFEDAVEGINAADTAEDAAAAAQLELDFLISLLPEGVEP